MRKIYVTRQRALACFGLLYHCVLGTSQEDHLTWIETQSREDLMCDTGHASMRNGETVCLKVGEEASSLFVIAYLEKRDLMTQTVPIPAGNEDLRLCVVTDYDGNRKLSIRLIPVGTS